MKKILFILILSVTVSSLIHAQAVTRAKYSSVKTTNLKPIPVETQTPPPPPPPPPAPKSEASASVYSLSSVRVNIRTGNDNKEFPSKVNVIVKTRDALNSDLSPFSQKSLDNEMRVNSDTEFGLEPDAQLRGDAKLEDFQKSGLKLQIYYYANFFADAWKIESVSMTIEFKDQFGNLHPTLGRKTIVFTNAYGFLNYDYRIMECVTDGSFTPITAVIKP